MNSLYVRAVAVLAIGVCFASPCHAQSGLAERRAIKQFQETKFAQVKKDLDTAVGGELTLVVDWDKVARPGEAELYNDNNYLMNTVFLPLIEALRQIGRDEMGKSSLKAGLKSVHVTYDEATAVASALNDGLKFDGGTLTINFTPLANADAPGEPHFKERQEAFTKALEAKL